ncbi:peptide/nickel transport system substrate-binding protein [Actinopolymorpha cephalotaxi]|uniref:Peptide/nickel transport system substrate-binding protein n=1 Tax=Actinopolymorpha cephalotaxi TaxID=504797 RepID=A0A1I2MRR3_9ACTN|nr:ABC transporter substrate-binding protein [Actinopolymorpha cephalotaxi]NYH85881.1 peptide/nickel transport system substrate-binding protein [Actinopolymorpha cephalotaxi]SFF93818.1 peptide/nickel transport system substrate-binding protein [Actinopolymorpha cephalotaxi]
MSPMSPDGSRRDFLKLTGLATSGLVLAAACGTPEAPPGPQPSQTSSRPVPRGKPKSVPREKTLMLANGDGSDVGICNPYASGFNHQRGLAAMFEPLYFYSAFTGETIPWLADGQPTYTSDNTKVTIKTRKDASWSDGKPFTAGDVAFTLTMLKDKKNTAMAYSADMREWVKSARAVDDNTVEISFTKPAPRFVFDYLYMKNDLGIFLVPEHIFSQQKKLTEFLFYDPAKKWPVVTGPYQMVDWTNQRRLLDRRDDWWASKAGIAQQPGPERVIVVPFTDPTNTAQRLINNELDSSLDLRPPVIKQVVKENPKIVTWSGRSAPYGYIDWWPQSLFFNCAVPPYNDPHVRRAVNHAIDRDQLVSVGYEGAGTISQLPFPNFPPLQKYFDALQPTLDRYPTNAHDPAKTEQIMKSKGFTKDNQNLWVDKSGKRLDATIYGLQDLTTDYGPILAEQLRAAGFNASHQAPSDSYTRIADGSAKLFLFGFAGAIADPYPSLELMHSRHVSKVGVQGDVSSRWKNADYDKIVERMSGLPVGDPGELPLFLQAMEIYLKNLPHTPVVQWLHRIPYNTTYWTGWPDKSDPYLPGAFWFKTLPLELSHLKSAKG